MIKTITKTALIAAIAGFATAASAEVTYNNQGAPVVEVNVRGYDLSTPEGLTALTNKVRATAHQVCATGSSDLGMLMKEKACFKRSFAEAQDKIEGFRLQTARRAGDERPIQTADSRTPR